MADQLINFCLELITPGRLVLHTIRRQRNIRIRNPREIRLRRAHINGSEDAMPEEDIRRYVLHSPSMVTSKYSEQAGREQQKDLGGSKIISQYDFLYFESRIYKILHS